MALEVGVNSYVTLAEADAYIASRYGYDKWDPLTDPEKESALVSAAQQMNSACNWYSSSLDFEFDPVQNPPPQEIKDAQCEIAYSIVVSGSATPASADPLSRLKAGDVELEWKASGGSSSPLYSDYTKGLLNSVGQCNYGGGTNIVDVSRAT